MSQQTFTADELDGIAKVKTSIAAEYRHRCNQPGLAEYDRDETGDEANIYERDAAVCTYAATLVRRLEAIRQFVPHITSGYFGRSDELAVVAERLRALLMPPVEHAHWSDEAINASLPSSVSPESPFAHNMRYHKLRYLECALWNELMDSPINTWPESLKELADSRQKQFGLCGEVIAAAVADWIRGIRALEEK